jgi:hypothetical protein
VRNSAGSTTPDTAAGAAGEQKAATSSVTQWGSACSSSSSQATTSPVAAASAALRAWDNPGRTSSRRRTGTRIADPVNSATTTAARSVAGALSTTSTSVRG